MLGSTGRRLGAVLADPPIWVPKISLTCGGEGVWHPDRWSRHVDRCGVSRVLRLGPDLTHSSSGTIAPERRFGVDWFG